MSVGEWGYLFLLISILLNLGLGYVVFRYSNERSKKWFILSVIASSLWMLTNVVYAGMHPDDRLSVALLSYGAAAILSVSFVLLCVDMVDPSRWSRLSRRLFVLFGIVVSVVSSIEGVIGISVFDNLKIETDTVALSLYGMFVTVNLVYGILTLIRGRQNSDGQQKSRLSPVIFGAVLSLVFGLVLNLILPIFGNYDFVQFGPSGVIFFTLFTSYAIVRRGLFDVKLAAVRTVGYALTLGVVALIYIFLVYGLSIIFFPNGASMGVSLSPLGVALALVLALIFQPIKQFFDQLTNRIFYHSDYDKEKFFRDFGKILSYDTNLVILLTRSIAHIVTNLNAERAFFYIKGRGVFGEGLRSNYIHKKDIVLLKKYYEKKYEPSTAMATNMITDEKVQRALMSYRVGISLPLTVQGEMIGCLFVGEHKSRGYTVRDFQALESIINELAIAVQNSLSVEGIRDLNESLQQKIKEATKELRVSNKQLQRLDEAKDEFVSMTSHQLRTPLTSVKGYLDMVLQGDLGRISATQRTVLSEAFMSSERMVSLIGDFLDVSRLKTGKFTIEPVPTNLAEVLQEELKMLKVLAKQRDLVLRVNIAKKLPDSLVDDGKVRQVMVNMIDNAIYYSEPGANVEIDLSFNKKDIRFEVKDSGIGVPESEQESLFGKFFRASNARKRRPDGTGVGLFLAKKVILSHGGEIIFSSKEGKGSTFGFVLPIKKPTKPRKD